MRFLDSLNAMTMKKNRKNLSLYVALLCIVGIIAIFFLDAYLGIYDTLYITRRGLERQVVGFEQRENWEYWTGGVYYGEVLNFRYEIANRRFGKYSTHIEASVWKGEERISTLFSGEELLKPFDEAAVEWKLESERLEGYKETAAPYTHYTVRIKTEKIEGRIILEVSEKEAVEPVSPKVRLVPPPR